MWMGNFLVDISANMMLAQFNIQVVYGHECDILLHGMRWNGTGGIQWLPFMNESHSSPVEYMLILHSHECNILFHGMNMNGEDSSRGYS